MLVLRRTAAAAPDRVEAAFKQDIASLNPDDLPLEQAMAHGNLARGEDLSAMLLRVEEDGERRRVHAGLFFSSRVIGCACADDPTPESDLGEYVEAVFDVHRPDGETRVILSECTHENA
ncbi:MAG: hypothetical protein ACQER6_07110 [Pseudomonadota bacterium]